MTGSRDPSLPGDGRAFGTELGGGARPVVLVVDAVNAYVERDSPLFLEDGGGAARSMKVLIECARAAGVPVCYANVSYPTTAEEAAPVFARKVPALRVFEHGSPLAGVIPPLKPREGELVVTKAYASAFFGTRLADTLRQRFSADTTIIVGYSTSGCIRATAIDAIQHDFRPLVVEQAVADTNLERHSANIGDLALKYADVVTLDDCLNYLRGCAEVTHDAK